MSNKSSVVKSIQAAEQSAQNDSNNAELAALMSDASYLRQSSALINEALQKGFDVLQLGNGDIVTTGTKTIVNTYSWDKSKQKLTKAKAAKKETSVKKSDLIEETLDES